MWQMQRRWNPNSSSDEDDDRWPRRNEPIKRRRKLLVVDEEEAEDSSGEEVSDEEMGVLKPIGEVVRVSGSGGRKLNHYKAFDCAGKVYKLGDSVLMCPENETQKPYVAIIKDIAHNVGTGKVMLTGQRFYRPEEAKKKEGGRWQTCYARELFYSFHQEEFAAGTVMHTCTVNFVPLDKQLPCLKQYPGFIVQKVYDTEQKKLLNLTDKDYEDTKQSEIDLLVNRTMARLVDVPDSDIEDTPPVDVEKAGLIKDKTLSRESNLSPMGKPKKDEGGSKYLSIIINFSALTKQSPRDSWLWRLLQSVEYVCTSSDAVQDEKGTKGKNQLIWPDSAVCAVTDLERASYSRLYTNFSKYNQKMRQLVNNLKSSALLAQRLLKQELKPSVIVTMTPTELKEGLTTEEIARNKPEETMRVQMTDAQCRICSERKVSCANIIKAGRTDRYELECLACGSSWYISREKAATLNFYEQTIKNTRTTSSDTTKLRSAKKKRSVASLH